MRPGWQVAYAGWQVAYTILSAKGDEAGTTHGDRGRRRRCEEAGGGGGLAARQPSARRHADRRPGFGVCRGQRHGRIPRARERPAARTGRGAGEGSLRRLLLLLLHDIPTHVSINAHRAAHLPQMFVPPGSVDTLQAVWPHLPNLRWCHSFFAGVDALTPAIGPQLLAQQIPFSNGRGAFSSSLAEYALTAVLHFNKQIPRCQANRQARKWDKVPRIDCHPPQRAALPPCTADRCSQP